MITIEERDWFDAAGAELRLAQRAELDARYGRDDHEPGGPPSAAEIDVFLVAIDTESGTAAGCGALRQLDPSSAEIKRMYVRPQYRGAGVSIAILRALEDWARARGWSTLRLETGTGQPDAIRFYQREGYRPIELYGKYIGSDLSLCFERAL